MDSVLESRPVCGRSFCINSSLRISKASASGAKQVLWNILLLVMLCDNFVPLTNTNTSSKLAAGVSKSQYATLCPVSTRTLSASGSSTEWVELEPAMRLSETAKYWSKNHRDRSSISGIRVLR